MEHETKHDRLKLIRNEYTAYLASVTRKWFFEPLGYFSVDILSFSLCV